jgi:hypothetical protein
MPEGLPTRPIAHSGADEVLVQPLVHAALTTGWKPALNLLYFHGTLLELSEEIGLPVLVSVRGDASGLTSVSELLKAQTSSGASRIMRSWMKEVIPRLAKAVQERGEGVSIGEVSAALGAKAAKEGGPHAKLIQDMLRKAFEDVVMFSGGLSALVFEFLLAKRSAYLTNVLPEAEYERMVAQLAKLGILEPRFEISICPGCHNHYLVVSGFPSTQSHCTRCGRAWVTIELFVFSQRFSSAELGSSLMALFVSAYLRERVNAQSPVIDLEIYPNAEFKPDPKTHAEVDVFVPRAALGYECKTFEDVFAPLTGSRLGSVAGRVLEQIESYSKLGIREIVIATNLPASGAQKVQRELSKRLQGDKARPTSLIVLPGSPNDLVAHLDQVATVLAKQLNADLGESFESGPGSKRGGLGPTEPPPAIEGPNGPRDAPSDSGPDRPSRRRKTPRG